MLELNSLGYSVPTSQKQCLELFLWCWLSNSHYWYIHLIGTILVVCNFISLCLPISESNISCICKTYFRNKMIDWLIDRLTLKNKIQISFKWATVSTAMSRRITARANAAAWNRTNAQSWNSAEYQVYSWNVLSSPMWYT